MNIRDIFLILIGILATAYVIYLVWDAERYANKKCENEEFEEYVDDLIKIIGSDNDSTRKNI